MGLKHSLKLWFIPKFVYILIRFSNWTIQLKVTGEEKVNKISDNLPLLYSVWHRNSWIVLYYLRNRNHIALTSTSRDGEYMTRILEKFGWEIVRGSSTRGGGRSLVKLYKKLLKGNSTVLTPDGPTGPIYKVKPGIVYLQEKSGGYIVPLGLAVDRKKEINSWDSYVIPYPMTRAVLSMGKPVQFSGEIDIEERCILLEEKMKRIQEKAERELSNY